MKALAIFKDSLREALDSKVLYATLGLSLLLVLLVGSVSFQPVPAEEALPFIVANQHFHEYSTGRGQSVLPRYMACKLTLDQIQKLTDAPEPQACDYRFRLRVNPAFAFREAVRGWNLPADTMPESFHSEVSDAGEAQRLEPIPELLTSTVGLMASPNVPWPALVNTTVLVRATAPSGRMPQGPPVTDDQMADFLKNQFALAGNLTVSKVERVPTEMPDVLEFQIETRGTSSNRSWQHTPALFFGALPMSLFRFSLGYMVYWIENRLINGFGAWIGILLGVIVTSFFIPNMLRKGTVDMLIVKPIHRTTLLLYKFLGGLTFMFLNSAVAVGGIWLVLGLRSGIWSPGFLATILILTFFFAILYAVSAFFAVLTRSAIVCILVTFLVWFVFWLVGWVYAGLDEVRNDPLVKRDVPEWVFQWVDVAHFVTPRTKDLDVLTTRLLSHDVLPEDEVRQMKLDRPSSINWGESLTVSLVFIGLMLGLSCWRFSVKDY